MNFSHLAKICNPESPGYNKLLRVANSRLRKGNISEIRQSYTKLFSEVITDVTKNYMHELGNPNTYKSNTKKVNSVLRTLYELVNDKPYTKRVKVYTKWSEFLKASTCQDVIDKRIVLLDKIFNKHRDAWINQIHVKDLGIKDGNVIQELQKFVGMYSPTTASGTVVASDYYSTKQHVQQVWRFDFVIAQRILQKTLKHFKLNLSDEYNESADLAVIFENGVSAFAIGKNSINVLIAPSIEFIENGDQYDLHSTAKPAYYSEDLGELYALHGVIIPKRLWDIAVNKKLTFDIFMNIKNMEQRRVVVDEAGAECFANHKNAVHSEVSVHGNKLITIKNITSGVDPSQVRSTDPVDMKILNYKDPSTGREYNSFVPPRLPIAESGITDKSNSHEVTDPDEAMAWKFGFDDKESYYGDMKGEA